MYSLSIWKFSLWKVSACGRRRTIVVLQDKRLWIVSDMSDVFTGCVLLISTMICFALDGKNDRCWMVLMFWDTFNIEIDCSVMRLSCLDELLNNDILLVVISVICVICLAKEVQYFGGTFGLWRLMFLFLSFFGRNDNISFWMEFCKRGVERSPEWIHQIAEEYSFCW